MNNVRANLIISLLMSSCFVRLKDVVIEELRMIDYASKMCFPNCPKSAVNQEINPPNKVIIC